MGGRRKAREKALQILFQLDFCTADVGPVLNEFWSTHPTGPAVREFTEKLVRGTFEHREGIDDMIGSTLENWTLDRLAAVDRAILRFAAFELMFLPEIPPKVTINEAVEIAKSYGTEESGRFINGVLDKIRGKIGKSIELTELPGTGSSTG
ncbi:MAG: transcription antitermination factor NusB [Candidatus Abyssobacteria bacterium SURF_17]|jgi:transcription antitermination factor NusB|uniref:Transcription antitermination protein NusB n=1 Tax=Candidatus Abyssobacteria bacterium SURF_17 TaxID=2093361 RepID=A0A419EVL4_9BACT|nr:MAG: transcription antitermination factor NusB [Candidatus Abyssubacteria bacterium SURF_17]